MIRMIEGTMKRSVLILTIVVLILAWGAVSAFQMQRDYLPPINNTTLMVTIQADQYQADQVKQIIKSEVEEAVGAVDKRQFYRCATLYLSKSAANAELRAKSPNPTLEKIKPMAELSS